MQVDPERGGEAIQNKTIVAEDVHDERWTSRGSFILAAIGSAIGLGNFWRFPYQVYKYGGGSFFIPYILALFVIGIPLMQLEFTLGQVYRRAGTQSFGRLDPRFAGLGIASSMISFGIVGYYCVILGWSNVMLIESFFPDIPWSIRGANSSEVIEIPLNHFYDVILHLGDVDNTEVIASYTFAGALVMWFSVWLILFKGQEFVSKAVWVTVLLPVGLLLFLVIFGATLDGAKDGIVSYIGEWDMSQLADKQMWVDAFSQILFSLSVAIGVMTGYASLNPRNQNVVQDGVIVACCNCFFSFCAGFAVFSIVGYMAKQVGMSMDELNDANVLSGPKLTFVVFPAGLSLIPSGGANVLCLIFFITVYMLGVDSAFSLVEAVVLNFRETAYFHHFSHAQLVSGVCLLGCFSTMLYTADIGYYLLDVVDYYVSSSGLPVMAFLETVVVGWVYNKQEVVSKVGALPVILHDALFWVTIILFTSLTNGLAAVGEYTNSEICAISFGLCVPLLIISFIVPAVLGSSAAGGFMEASYTIFISAPDSLRNEMNDAICDGAPNNWRLRKIWVYNVKYVMGPILLYLIGINISNLASQGGYLYDSDAGIPYAAGYQAFGAILWGGLGVLVGIGIIWPQVYRDPNTSSSASL